MRGSPGRHPVRAPIFLRRPSASVGPPLSAGVLEPCWTGCYELLKVSLTFSLPWGAERESQKEPCRISYYWA